MVELILKNRTNLAAKLSTKYHRFRAGWDFAISRRHINTDMIIFVHQRMFRRVFKCCLAAGTPCRSSLSKYFFVPIK